MRFAASELLLGPLYKFSGHPVQSLSLLVLVLVLTVLTQIGGLILWLSLPLLRRLKRRWRGWGFILAVLVYVGMYGFTSFVIVPPLAALQGRVPLPLFARGEIPVAPAVSWIVLLNRHYVRQELSAVLIDAGKLMSERFPGTKIHYLDGNFPFWDGFPLLPHLSHKDGRKVDVAFVYQDKQTGNALPNHPTPFGYWVYEQPHQSEPQPCRGIQALNLRWDFHWMQPLFADVTVAQEQTAALAAIFSKDERVGKILLEPHLKQRWGLSSSKVRFQGCRPARHDDHMHVQL